MDFIKALFKDVIENKNYDETLINKYFSENYIQIVDNVELDFETFKKHIKKLKDKIQQVDIAFLNLAENDHSIFTKHQVTSILNTGEVVKHKVFAEFLIKDGKVFKCEEMTLQIEGSPNESNLGSAV
ncbi:MULTISPECIES: hypothetical protein [unclassified Sphingobacterium]|uniref:hypothetical protein n=1 Tax=unclassified Sphingobacterium TaxID=2609468 RepID=UPI0013EE1409|nr:MULTISPECIES: hypothetical protein [unclassified Sphingobacterium]MDM1296879.1 hypothetical protein [Sphingobacterium sp. N143]NGM65079.1 hypothetical protein [Sphingobacterium sp. SGR-19]